MIKLWKLALVALFITTTSHSADDDVSCFNSSGTSCSAAELSQPGLYKQIVVFPTGFTQDERSVFDSEVQSMILRMANAPGPVYSTVHKDRIVYISVWLPGPGLETDSAVFKGKVRAHPIRGKALSLDQDQVLFEVSFLQSVLPFPLQPFAVGILFNSLEDEITANAAPPTFLGKNFGIAKFNRKDLEQSYIATHELAHAGLNFVDEYVEEGFQDLSISTLDMLSPLAVLNGSFGGVMRAIRDLLGIYNINISEVLAANGSDNIDTSRYPSRVVTPSYTPNPYEYEGGMFFGRGTFHDRANNLMNGNTVMRAEDDGFAYAHSLSQTQVASYAFRPESSFARRPNDRLRNAGPLTAWPSQWGGTATLMLFDADKNHRFHPTLSYNVQVGWYDRDWKVCYKWKVVPYPCYDDVWKTFAKSVTPAKQTLELKGSALFGTARFFLNLACDLGVKKLNRGGANVDLCSQSLDEMAQAFLPTFVFATPYQNVSIPTSQWLTKYYWRFQTTNGSMSSGFTSWATFRRYL